MNLKIAALAAFFVAMTGCGGGGRSDNVSCGTSSENTTTISGNITYDFVPHFSSGALDYNNISTPAVRGATVELRYKSGSLYSSTVTDSGGNYSLEAPINEKLRIQVKAELQQTGTPAWQIRVTDNTEGDALYLMQGSVSCTGDSMQTRDLNASSGWTGSGYGNTRVAAPFAIIDSVYQSLQLLLTVDANLSLPPVELRWSVDNRAVNGNPNSGNIGTSSYDGENIHILGHADNDTDEYDRSVIQHEFAHFLEHRISRSDSIGGSHGPRTKTDMRVAFSEGLANAFTAIASASGIYEDSVGEDQGGGFRYSMESNNEGNFGWFSENSVNLIIYDIYDSNDDGVDSISLGFSPIYQALTSASYRNGQALTSIYAFADALRAVLSANDAAGFNDLMTAQQIFGSDAFGSAETNDGDLSYTLPIYQNLIVGSSVNLCTSATSSSYNGFDVRRFATFDIDTNDSYSLNATKTSGPSNTNPNLYIYQAGDTVAAFESSTNNSESGNASLNAGSYVIELYNATGAQSCFDLSIDTGNN